MSFSLVSLFYESFIGPNNMDFVGSDGGRTVAWTRASDGPCRDSSVRPGPYPRLPGPSRSLPESTDGRTPKEPVSLATVEILPVLIVYFYTLRLFRHEVYLLKIMYGLRHLHLDIPDFV